MQRVLFALSIMFTLAACGSAPGMEGLRANSLHAAVTIDRPYEDVAICVARRFDSAPNSLGDLPMPANGFRHIKGESAIEVYNQGYQSGAFSAAGVFAYFVTFRQIAPSRTAVDILASRDVNPYLGKSYVMDKVIGNLEACGIPS